MSDRNRGMTLSKTDWLLIQIALFNYGSNSIQSGIANDDIVSIRIGKDAIALAKDIRKVEDFRNQEEGN